MEIIIHQIICGEDDKGGYGLLKSSLLDSKLAKKIAFNTDIQEQTGTYQWDSAIRGFVVDDYFLIMKTFPDKSADVRPGRVFSHVLLIQKTELNNIQNLTPILEILPDKIDKEINVESILYKEESDFVTDTSSSSYQGRFNKVIHGYANAQDFSKTIIWIGVENFNIALSHFWKVLPVEDKETLNFGLNFNADAIPKGKLNFINIPENIESKFLNKGFCVVRKNENYVLKEIFEQLIAGDTKANERISNFKTIVETGDLSRDAVNNIGKVLNTFENIDSTSDLKKLNTLSHVVAEYSPLIDKGVSLKEKLLERICNLISICDLSELHLIKPFKTSSFNGSERKLSQSVNKWLENYLFSQNETRTKNYSLLFEKLNGNNSNWWTVNIKHQLDVFLSSIDIDKVSIVMNWLNQDISILDIIEPLIDISSESENSFTIYLSKSFNKSHFQNLVSFALSRKWLRFHAKLMIFEYSFEQALSNQLLVDVNEDFSDGINEIIINISPIAVINFTINNGDNRLIKICGKYCHTDSSLLANIEISNVNWQAIWLHSILLGNEIFDGITEPQEKVYFLLNNLLDGESYNIDLLEKISNTLYGNILYYPKRKNIWKFIPNSIRTNFLKKTSTALLQKISTDTTTVIPDDKELSDFIISNGISDFLYFNRNNFNVTLPIFITFKQLPEYILKDYVSNYYGNLNVIEAIQLGKLVYERNYKDVVYAIYYKANKSNNWKFGLSECHNLLDFFTKAALAFSDTLKTVNITTDQWWESAEEIICDFYPNGVSLAAIWKKAGGKESELLINTTAENVWRDVILKLRNNGLKNVTMNSLLKEINKTYGENEKFKLIYQLRKNYITC